MSDTRPTPPNADVPTSVSADNGENVGEERGACLLQRMTPLTPEERASVNEFFMSSMDSSAEVRTTEGKGKMTISELMRSERIGYLEAKRRVETSEQMAVRSPVDGTDRDALVWKLVVGIEHGWLCIRNTHGWLLWSAKTAEIDLHRGIVMADIADELRKNQAAWQKDFDERERDDNEMMGVKTATSP